MKWERLIIAALAVALCFSGRSCLQKGDALENAIQGIGKRDTVLSMFVDRLGREHSIVKEREFTIKTLKESNEAEIVALRSEYEGRLKNLQSRITVYVKTTDTVRTDYHDTLIVTEAGVDTGQTFTFHDDWSFIGGTLLKGNVDLTYSFRTGIRMDRAWMRPKWYKRKELTLDVVMMNPNAELDGVQTFLIKPDPLRWYETKGAAMLGSFMLGLYLGTR